jgi:hypothetical protein
MMSAAECPTHVKDKRSCTSFVETTGTVGEKAWGGLVNISKVLQST